MRLPRVRFTIRRMMLIVAAVGVVIGVGMTWQRRQSLLNLAAEKDQEEFLFRGCAKRSMLLAALYDNPPQSEKELNAKCEEMHPLPQFACVACYPTMTDLTRFDEDGRRIRSMRIRENAYRYLKIAVDLSRERYRLQQAASFPWETIPLERPLPTKFVREEPVNVDELRRLPRAR